MKRKKAREAEGRKIKVRRAVAEREIERQREGKETKKQKQNQWQLFLVFLSFIVAKFTFCFGLILIFGIHSANIFVHLFSFIYLVIQISVYRQRNYYSDRVNWKTRQTICFQSASNAYKLSLCSFMGKYFRINTSWLPSQQLIKSLRVVIGRSQHAQFNSTET